MDIYVYNIRVKVWLAYQKGVFLLSLKHASLLNYTFLVIRLNNLYDLVCSS
jgi:hypothetical protein